MVNYTFPSVSTRLKLERRCPNCCRPNGNIHSGIIRRPISDLKISHIGQRRMKCPWCKTTWTMRTEGVADGRQRTDQLICIGVFLYMLGLSYRAVEAFVHVLGCKGSKSTVERDVGRLGQKARTLHSQSLGMGVQILGVDGTGAKIAGRSREGMLFFVDIGTGKLLFVVRANEIDSRQVRQHVQRIIQLVGAKELRTDELSVYDGVVVDGSRTICLTHWLRSKCRRAYELSRQLKAEGLSYESQTMLEFKQLLHDRWRWPTVPPELERLVRRFINCRRGTLWKVN
jgi:transposase-like protein